MSFCIVEGQDFRRALKLVTPRPKPSVVAVIHSERWLRLRVVHNNSETYLDTSVYAPGTPFRCEVSREALASIMQTVGAGYVAIYSDGDTMIIEATGKPFVLPALPYKQRWGVYWETMRVQPMLLCLGLKNATKAHRSAAGLIFAGQPLKDVVHPSTQDEFEFAFSPDESLLMSELIRTAPDARWEIQRNATHLRLKSRRAQFEWLRQTSAWELATPTARAH